MSDNENKMTMEQLKAAMKEVAEATVPASVKTQLDILVAKNTELERKLIFPRGEGTFQDGHFETTDGSVINTVGFAKAMNLVGSLQSKGINVSDAQIGHIVLSNGGIYTKLSPAMEQFAKMLKGKLNPDRMVNLGFNRDSYMDMIAKQIKQTGMNEGVGADGGFTVPVEYAATVIEFAILMSAILSKVWRVPMKSNKSKWPRLAQTDESFFGGFCFDWLDEGDRKPENKVAFEQVSFEAHKCAAICVLTDELIEDSLINIVNYITALGARAWMYELEHCVIDGSGVGQPLGIGNDPVIVHNAIGRTTAHAIDWRDFNNLEAAMNENFRNLEWIFRRATLSAARNLVDGNSRPIWTEQWSTYTGTPTMVPTVLGYPYHVTRNANRIGHLGDVILGDLSYYMLATRKDMSIDVSPYPYWKTDETAVRFVARIDGKPGTPYAFKILKGTGS